MDGFGCDGTIVKGLKMVMIANHDGQFFSEES